MLAPAVSLARLVPEPEAPKLSWRQELVLKAAASVDYLPWRHTFVETPGTIPHGVYRSLVMHGYLRHHPCGYEVTPEGREALR